MSQTDKLRAAEGQLESVMDEVALPPELVIDLGAAHGQIKHVRQRLENAEEGDRS